MGCTRLVAMTLALLVAATASTAAQNTIKLSNGATVRGEIVEYDERGLKIRLESGRTIFHPTSEVQLVDAPFTDLHRAAVEALARRDFSAAAAKFQEAGKTETRDWARHQIQAGLIRAYRGLGRLDDAGRLFLDIYAHRDDPEVLVLAPLIWNDQDRISPETTALARQWLGDERPAARLLAASWLLLGPEAAAASAKLDDLQTLDQRMGWMARAQLWRIKPNPAADEIDRFRTLIGRMPLGIRSGPQFVLASAIEKQGRLDDAALAYLWIPYVYSPGSDLAAEALLRAAAASRQCGLAADSDKIYREVVQTFPGTAWATRAERELAGASSKTPGG